MVKSIMASRPGNEAAKQSQTITVLSPCLTVGIMFLFLKCCVSFSPSVTGRTPSKKFHLCLVGSQNFFPKVSGIIKMSSWQM